MPSNTRHRPCKTRGQEISLTLTRHLDYDQVLVEGINTVKRHQKPNPQAGKQGGILEKSMPLPLSKVAIYNPASQKADRIGFKTLTDGKKVRFFKSNGEMIDA